MSELFGILILFAPLFLIIWLANLAEQNRERELPHRGLAFISYGLVFLVYSLAALVGFGLQAAAVMIEEQPTLFAELGVTAPGVDFSAQFASLTLLSTGVWVSALVGILLLTPIARRAAARVIPIDPDNPVHGVSLALIMLVAINLTVTLGIGLENLTALLEEQAAAGETSATSTTLTLWVQQIATALLALVGVGWATRRDWSQSLVRLGVVRPTQQQVWLGIGLGVGLVPVVMLLEYLLNTLLGISIDPDVEELTEQLLGPLFGSPFGILTLGLAAALGEETIFRGALQPRFGLILTALLFAIVHSNYGVSVSTLVVFLLGIVLGLVRIRHNTSTSMIVHAIYNITLGLLAYLSLNILENF